MNHPDHAVELFNAGRNCSQAVLMAFAGELGLEPDAAARLAAGFGGGMGRMGHTCGAVSGAVLVRGPGVPAP
jgi:C_GCAxxG_C_C family probable redox protein